MPFLDTIQTSLYHFDDLEVLIMILEILWNKDISIDKSINMSIVNINMSRVQGFNWLYVERDIDDLGKGIFFNLDEITCWRVKAV